MDMARADLSAAAKHRRINQSAMRSPIPFAPPPMPVVASALVRDDVPLEAIPPADWNALAGSQPFLDHRFLAALHATGCA
jgi:hypothetical protein